MPFLFTILRKILWHQYNKTVSDIKTTTSAKKQDNYLAICYKVAIVTDIVLLLIPNITRHLFITL